MSSDSSIPRVAQARTGSLQQQLERVWHQTAMTAMINALAHELNQPLTAITLHCDAALTSARAAPDADPEIVDEIRQAAAGAYRAGEIVASLRRFMTRPEPPSNKLQLNHLVETAAKLAEQESAERGVGIEFRLDPQLPELVLNRLQIIHLILNLIRHSIATRRLDDRAPPAITIVTRLREAAVEMSISCDGAGRAAELGRFSLLDAETPAAALDAAIRRMVVDAHGGRMWAEPRGEHQSDIIVSLPVEGG